MNQAHQIGIQLRTIQNRIKRRIDSSPVNKKIENMTGTNAWLIAHIAEKTEQGAEVYQKDIEEEFAVTRSTVSKVVKLMEQKNMVSRESVPDDARLKRLVLTKQAQEIAEELKEDASNMEAQLLEGFTREEQERLSGYLTRILNNLEKAQRNS